MRLATKRLIDSVWTVSFEVVDGKAVIHSYGRGNAEGYKRERELMQVTLIEDDDRTVKELLLKPYTQFNGWVNADNCTERYEVANPGHIFGYGA
jgi:hypothetical protein